MSKKKAKKGSVPVKPKSTAILIGTLIVIVGLLIGREIIKPLLQQTTSGLPVNPKMRQQALTVGKHTLMVEVRDTPQGRELGLSGRASIGEEEGVLFIFPKASRQLFWMQDMLFDLDVLWIAQGRVIDISPRVPAPTKAQPKIATMTTAAPVDMVLEVNAGWVERHGVSVGDEVTLSGS